MSSSSENADQTAKIADQQELVSFSQKIEQNKPSLKSNFFLEEFADHLVGDQRLLTSIYD